MGGLELRKEKIGFRLRLRNRDAGLEAAENRQRVAPSAPEVHNGGHVEIHLHSRGENRAEIERGGQDTDHGDRSGDAAGRGVDGDGLPDNRRVAAKLALPERMAQQRRGPAAFAALIGREEPSQGGLDAQHREEVFGYLDADHGQRIAQAREFVLNGVEESLVARHTLERTVITAELLECGDRVGLVREAALATIRSEPHQPARLAEGQRTQQDGVDHAEDRDIGADSQGQHQDNDAGKRAISPQGAQGKAQVLAQDVQRRQAASIAMLLHRPLHAAKADEGLAARLFRQHALAEIVLDPRVDMGADLGSEINIEWLPAKCGDDAAPRPPKRIDQLSPPSPENASTRPITSVNLCQ